jgi:uncharacterized protein (DUF983 family)
MTTDVIHFPAAPSSATTAERPLGLAIRRGFVGRCPNCGEGRLFRAYLKVVDACDHCGEDLSHHRSDDAPPYVTMLIVGHFVIAGVLATEELAPDSSLVIGGAIWTAVAIVSSLLLLPRVKGALVGYQWAMRMHGFGGPEIERF